MKFKPPFLLLGYFFLLITLMLWWGFAFLPLPDSAPAWVEQARWVCFGLGDNGLPQGYGWMMLIGAPVMMLTALGIGWGHEWNQGKQYFRQNKIAIVLAVLLIVSFMTESHFIGKKITAALRSQIPQTTAGEFRENLSSYPRLSQPVPQFALYDESGKAITPDSAAGRVLYITFAFAHCKAICPLLAENLKRVHEAVGTDKSTVYIISLDPWRDTVGSLADMHRQWNLPTSMHVLSGSPEEVNKVLDAFQVPRSRDEKTGEVVHPALIDVVDPQGQLSYVFNGASQSLLIKAGESLLH